MVGFEHLEQKSAGRGRGADRRSERRASTTSAGTSTRRWPLLRRASRGAGVAARHAAPRSSSGKARPREFAPIVARAIVQAPPRHHAAARHRLRPAPEGERHHRAPLLGPRLRAAEASRAPSIHGDRRQARGLLGDEARRERRVRGPGRAGQDPRPLQRHRDLHRQGHRLPALEVRPARPHLRLPQVLTYADGHVCGRRRRDDGLRPSAPQFGGAQTRLQRHRRPADLPAEGRQGRRCASSATRARRSTRSTSPTRWWR